MSTPDCRETPCLPGAPALQPGILAQRRAGAPAHDRAPRTRPAARMFAAGATLLAACQFTPEALEGPGAPDPVDASTSPGDASPAPVDERCGWPFEPRHFDPCAPDNPASLTRLVLDQDGIYIYDTDTGLLTDPRGIGLLPVPPSTLEQERTVRALWVGGLDLQSGATLRVQGSRPLMIVSTDEIAVSGVIDVSSTWDPATLTFDPGAGADPPSDECASNDALPGGDCKEGGGGGGGGGFGGDGAAGGSGAVTRACDGSPGIAGGAGGDAVRAPATIRGGCKGARGGNGEIDFLYGLGGFGGGAVHLVSRVAVDVRGTVHAGGAAGSGAEDDRSGGGGGGSGGFIGLEAPAIQIGSSAILAANGGAGGGGCNQGLADSGEDGKSSSQAAIGGAGESTSGGDGGNGSAGSARAGEPGKDADRGGGGGAGGAGYIVAYQSAPVISAQAVVSPPFTAP